MAGCASTGVERASLLDRRDRAAAALGIVQNDGAAIVELAHDSSDFGVERYIALAVLGAVAQNELFNERSKRRGLQCGVRDAQAISPVGTPRAAPA